MHKKNNNQLIFFGAFLLILILLFFSLGKTLWQKEQDKKEKPTAQEEETGSAEKTAQELFPLISARDLEEKIGQKEFIFIDLRQEYAFNDCHIESSINLSPEELENLPENYKDKKIVIIDDPIDNSANEKISALQKRGFNLLYLDGGFEKYRLLGLSTVSFGYPDSIFDVSKTKPIDLTTLKKRLEDGEVFQFLDVRSAGDFKTSHISGSTNIPLEELEARKSEVPFGRLVVVDSNPTRAFQAAVRLFDLHFIDIVYLSENLEKLKN